MVSLPPAIARHERAGRSTDFIWLAEFYGVPTQRLNEQVKRNKNRFPDDFMFQPKYIDTILSL